VGATGLGLLVEEHRAEIAGAWREAVLTELRIAEPALGFAVAPLLREMSLALGGQGDERRSRDAWARCAVLVRSTAAAAQLAREFKLLHRAVWEAFRAAGTPVAPADRRSGDEWLDEALAHALDRLERVRLRVAALDPGAGAAARAGIAAAHAAAGRTAPSARTTPPPLPRPRTVPPPLPRRVGDDMLELEPAHH
jgi:hypothetical protein